MVMMSMQVQIQDSSKKDLELKKWKFDSEVCSFFCDFGIFAENSSAQPTTLCPGPRELAVVWDSSDQNCRKERGNMKTPMQYINAIKMHPMAKT